MRLSKACIMAILALGLVASAYALDVSGGKRVGPQAPTVAKQRPNAPDFGIIEDHYVRVGGSEFIVDPAAGGTYSNGFVGGGSRWTGWITAPGAFDHVYAWVHAPGGSLLDYVELDYCNTDPTAGHDLIMSVYNCDFDGSCAATAALTLTGAANSGCSDVSGNPGPLTTNNFDNEYLLDVAFPTAGLHNGAIGLAGAIVGWKYQVSPAPATATFNDVQPGDFGFQQIEALAASGITGGCQVSPPLYCPNDNLTRAQMAVFLAKALGLYWGGF